MNNKIKTTTGVLVFVVLIAAASLAYDRLKNEYNVQDNLIINDNADAQEEAQGETEEERIIAPDFTVIDAEGNEVKLSEMFGKPIVLNFWASWCPPCKSEMPEFNKVYEEMGVDIQFMMVDLVDGQRETVKKGEKYISEQGFIFPVYYDTKGEAGYNYGISSIPTTIFIDKDGYVITGAQGAIDEKTLRKGISLIE